MNERIKELAEQAGCKVMDGEWYIPSAIGLEKIVYTNGMGLEKFAELIVQECIATIANDTANYPGEGMMAYYQGVQDACKSIKQHFGVEE